MLKKIFKELISDLNKFINFLEKDFSFEKDFPFNEIYIWCEKNLGDECIEYIVSLMMEPFDNIVNPLINQMSSEEEKYFTIPTNRKILELRNILEMKYADILQIDFSKKESNQNFWFICRQIFAKWI